MATMVTQRMMDNLSYTLLAKNEFQTSVQARGTAPNNIQAPLDSELARENTLLRQQLLETSADNDAISKSLQERAQSLANMTDAKIRAETEAKVLQVQLKSMQKDIDAHKYELHLLRKQLQIRNEEREHHKKASEASYKQHLDNVKKIARLESECQRLHGLIRQRVPGLAAIAQMRAECDMHVKMDIKKRSPSVVPNATSSKNLHNSSLFQAQREIEGLKERLFSVEDEAKFLKEAMTKRTTELQEARQLCARTAMKLSAAQALVEALSTMDTAYSTPSTPMHPHASRVPFLNSDHLHTFLNQDMTMLKSGGSIGENNGVYASSTMHGDVDNGVIDANPELENDGLTTNGELDEVSCAETWASALFAELSHLSNLHKDTLIIAESVGNRKQVTDETSKCMANVQELDIYSAMEMVNQRLSSVGEGILTSGLTIKEHTNSLNTKEDINTSANLCSTWHNDTNLMTQSTHNNNDILEEILKIKGLLLDIDRAMEMMGKRESADHLSKYSCGYEDFAYDEELNVNQNAHEAFNRERGLSRLRYNSLEHGNESSAAGGTKYSGQSNKMEDMSAKFSKKTDGMEDMGIKLSEETDRMQDMGIKLKEDMSAKPGEESDELADMGSELSGQTDEMQNMGIQFKEETDEMEEMATKFSEQANVMEDVGTKLGERNKMGMTSASGDVCICSGGNTAATAILEQLNAAGTASCGQLNLAALAASRQVAREESDMASDLEADVQLEEKLHAAQAELDLASDRIAKLEAELARSLQEKADVLNELSDTRSLKQSLQAELACALASVEDLKLQLSALQVSQVDQASHGTTNVSPFKIRPPTLAHLDVHDANMNEELELAVARAQLADCQRSIHVIRKQMVTEIQHEALQDVISDDQLLFDTFSEYSKSTDQSSQLTSPIIDNISCFVVSPSKNVIAKTIEDALTQQECKTHQFSTSSRSHSSYEDNNFEQVIQKDGHAIEEQHSKRECKDLEPSNKTMHVSRTSSKNHVNKSTQHSLNLLGSSTTSRIAEFFGRAKLTSEGS